jgi:beta-glucanase (GH16 family)
MSISILVFLAVNITSSTSHFLDTPCIITSCFLNPYSHPTKYVEMYSILLIPILASLVAATTPDTINGFNPIFTEDFSATAIDTTKWQFNTAAPANGEQETYTNLASNCVISPAKSLVITPQRDANGKWTSCRLESINAFAPVPGGQLIVEASIKLGTQGASLQGIWPAFWSLGESIRQGAAWPACGEIDTFEEKNGNAMAFGTLHCGTACSEPDGLSQGTAFNYDAFHTWGHAIDLRNSDWTAQTITWYLDGTAYHVVKGSDIADVNTWNALTTKGMFMVLNVAVGGTWPGNPTGATVPGAAAQMEVDFVGVYKSV